MSYNDLEISTSDGKPVELYTFTRDGKNYYYTSYQENIVFDTITYLAIPIARASIEGTSDLGRVSLKVTMSILADFVKQYIASSPAGVVSLTITRFHRGDTNTAIAWKGRVSNVRFGEAEVEVTCLPIYAAIRRPGLRRQYQATCPHVLYNSPCNVVKETFEISATILSISGNLIESPSFIVDVNPTYNSTWFVGGFVLYNNGQVIDRRFIVGHDNVTGVLTLNLAFAKLTLGSVVKAYPGCNHTIATCKDKFSNLDNYGGFPYIPIKNPMDGTSIF